MKNLITVITVLVFIINVNAQPVYNYDNQNAITTRSSNTQAQTNQSRVNTQVQTTNPYAELQHGYNYHNNPVAANYAATGTLPPGYYTKTAQEISHSQGAADMWVKYDHAADINKEINGGHIANPAEVFIMTPQGNMHSAARCGNHPVNVQFHKNPVVIVNVTTQKVDLKRVYSGQAQIEKRLDDVDENQQRSFGNQRYIANAVDASTTRDATILQKLDEINTSSINAEKYAKQARNWAITSTAVSTVGLGFGIYNALRPMPRIISNQNINLLNSRPVVNRPGGGGGSPPPGGGGAGPAGNR